MTLFSRIVSSRSSGSGHGEDAALGLADELSEGSFGAGEAAAAVGGNTDETGGVRGAIDEVFVLDTAIGADMPFAASPILT